MTHTTQKTALVVGAAGGIGFETADALVRHGWRVRGLVRRRLPARPGVEYILGDAMKREDVAGAATGADLIVHAVNPPGYRDWDKLVLPMIDNTIAAARAEGARIVLPGSIYNFGAGAPQVVTEDTPQNPTSRKGAIRKEMEARIEAAAHEGARGLVVRAGDFYGPHTANNWFGALIKPGVPVKSVMEPMSRGTRHAFGYLPDVAETIARLAGREAGLAPFERFHVAGHIVERGGLTKAVRAAVDDAAIPMRPFPWALLPVLAPFSPLMKELIEMRYLWRQTQVLDGSKLARFLGDDLPATPLDVAVKDSLRALGCLKAGATDAACGSLSPQLASH